VKAILDGFIALVELVLENLLGFERDDDEDHE
jgi:hypothetical protein